MILNFLDYFEKENTYFLFNTTLPIISYVVHKNHGTINMHPPCTIITVDTPPRRRVRVGGLAAERVTAVPVRGPDGPAAAAAAMPVLLSACVRAPHRPHPARAHGGGRPASHVGKEIGQSLPAIFFLVSKV